MNDKPEKGVELRLLYAVVWMMCLTHYLGAGYVFLILLAQAVLYIRVLHFLDDMLDRTLERHTEDERANIPAVVVISAMAFFAVNYFVSLWNLLSYTFKNSPAYEEMSDYALKHGLYPISYFF